MVVTLTAVSSPEESQAMNRAIGRSIAEHRARAGYSIKAFAEMVGIGYEKYKTIEYGRYKTSAIHVWMIADALNIGIDELIGRTVPNGEALLVSDDERIRLIECFANSTREQRDALLLTAEAFSSLENTASAKKKEES